MDERYLFDYQLDMLMRRWRAEDENYVGVLGALVAEMDRAGNDPLMNLLACLPDE